MPRKSFPALSNKVESVFQFWHCIFIHFKPHALYGKHPYVKSESVVVGAAFMAARGAAAISASLPLNAAAARAGIHPAPTRNRGRGRRGGLHGRPWGSCDFCKSSAQRNCGSGGDKPRPYKNPEAWPPGSCGRFIEKSPIQKTPGGFCRRARGIYPYASR